MAEVNLETAVEILKADGVVAFPTETVYGLGARIGSESALNKIFSTKERPFFDPLIVHVDSIQQAKSCFSEWSEIAQTLTKSFWPGPLTLVMKKSGLISDVITSGLPRVGVRWPQHALAQQLISQVGEPLAAPSANKFGKTSPTQIEHVVSEFGSELPILHGEPSQVGIESTVLLVDQNNLSLLRKGLITKSEISRCLEKFNIAFNWIDVVGKSMAPGQMKHHYMPIIPFVIVKPQSEIQSEAQILEYLNKNISALPDSVDKVKIVKPKGAIKTLQQLVLPVQPVEAARLLYSELREQSSKGADALFFKQEELHQGEIWESIFDRLYKAASLIID